MESLTDYGSSGMDNSTKVCHFLQGMKNTEMEAVVNVVWAQPENHEEEHNYAICPYCKEWKSASDA